MSMLNDVETVERRCRLDRPEIFKETALFPLTKLELTAAFNLAALVRSLLPTPEVAEAYEKWSHTPTSLSANETLAFYAANILALLKLEAINAT